MRWAPCGFLPGQAEKSWAVSCSQPCSCGTRTLQSHQAAAGHQPRLLPLPLPWSPLRSAGGAGRFLGPNPGSEGRKSAAAKERKPAGFPCASARRVRGAGRSQIANEIGGGGSISFLPYFLGRTREAWPGHCFLQLLLGWAVLALSSPCSAGQQPRRGASIPRDGTRGPAVPCLWGHSQALSPAPCGGQGGLASAWPWGGPSRGLQSLWDPQGGCRAHGCLSALTASSPPAVASWGVLVAEGQCWGHSPSPCPAGSSFRAAISGRGTGRVCEGRKVGGRWEEGSGAHF